MPIVFKNSKHIDAGQLNELYDDVQWYAYTKDMQLLQQAVMQSLDVVTAWDGEALVGMIRVVGDGLTIIYVQDILVRTAYHNQGIATQLMKRIMDRYPDVRQKVLLTEEAPDVRHFYEKNGFQSCDQGSLVAFARFN